MKINQPHLPNPSWVGSDGIDSEHDEALFYYTQKWIGANKALRELNQRFVAIESLHRIVTIDKDYCEHCKVLYPCETMCIIEGLV